MPLIVVLYMITFNTWTGELLREERIEIGVRFSSFEFSTRGDTIEFCRKFGLERARELHALQFWLENPKWKHVSTNIDCQWERQSV